MSARTKPWDVIIIGGGPAGISAATVLTRSRRSVVIIDEGNQRNLRSHGLHNFITRDGILPPDFLRLATEELSHYPVNFVRSYAKKAAKIDDGFLVTDSSGENFLAKKLLLCTGVTDTIPDVPGMRELWGCAVFHCPFCDGYECKDEPIGLYAQKKNGYGMAIALKHLSKKVTLFTDGAFYLKPFQKKALEEQGINVVTRRVARLLYDHTTLHGVELTNGAQFKCTAMFTHHGLRVNRILVDQLGCLCTKKGEAITNRHQQTNVPGVYVAGDASIDMHFAVVAAAEGVKAAVTVHNDLLQEENREALKLKDK
jgi:thioredoxin reductase